MVETTNIPQLNYENCIVRNRSDSESSFSLSGNGLSECVVAENVPNAQSNEHEDVIDDLQVMCDKVSNTDLSPQDIFNFTMGMLIRTELVLEQKDKKFADEKQWLKKQISIMKTVFLKNENLFFKRNVARRRNAIKRHVKIQKRFVKKKIKINCRRPMKSEKEIFKSQKPEESLNEFCDGGSSEKKKPLLNSTFRRSQRILDHKDKEVMFCDKLTYTALKLQPYTSTPIVLGSEYKRNSIQMEKRKRKENLTSKSSTSNTELWKKRSRNDLTLGTSVKTTNSGLKRRKTLFQNVPNGNKNRQQPFQMGQKAKSLLEIPYKSKIFKKWKSTSLQDTLTNKVRSALDEHLEPEKSGPSSNEQSEKVKYRKNKSLGSLENSKSNKQNKRISSKRGASSWDRSPAKKAKRNEEKASLSKSLDLSGKRKLYDPDTWLNSLDMTEQQDLQE